MDELIPLVVILVIGILAAGPAAFIMTLVLFNKVGKLEEKLRRLSSGRHPQGEPRPVPKPAPVPTAPPAAPPSAPTPQPVMTAPQTEPKKISPAVEIETHWPVKPAEPPVEKAKAPAAIAKPALPKLPRVNLEQKIGTKILPIAAIITVIVGVAFFLKILYDKAYFGPPAKVCLVTIGGLAALVIGEITRRRSYEIVAKGTTALGFALLYAAVFSASRVYMLIEMQTAFILAIVITAGAMAYAVALNEVIIAFLSLLGGYLSPIIITTGQNLAVPLFSYLLALAVGALGCAMFRRWRMVNWITLVGTWLLYTGWFEKFYTPSQMTLALSWLGVFGGLFLLQPILYGLKQKVPARAKDVGLIVANSATVFYYLWRMLNADHPQAQAIAAAVVGAVHLALAIVVRLRCREDNKLQAALGVLGTAFVTTAVPLYFAALNPTLLSWSVEAVALTYIGIRYRSLWTKVMALLVSAIAAVGLFYHLPLHGAETFKIVFNAPFGTWLFVAAAMVVCHLLWRFMAEARDEEGVFAAQAYYLAGVLLMAAACMLEWFTYCDRFIESSRQGQSVFLLGAMAIAAALMALLLTRPVCPKGQLVRTAGVLAAMAGSIYTAMAMMGVYHTAFRLFANGPFATACGYAAVVLLCAGWIRKTEAKTPLRDQLTGALGAMGLGLVFILLAEQGYWYWYCQHKYVQPIANWQASASYTVALCWAVFGLAMLAGALRFDTLWAKVMAMLAAAASTVVLFGTLPLHADGDFRFMLNLPFIAWIAAAAALIAGHGLWRTVKIADAQQGGVMAQLYYTLGVALAAVGWAMEWHDHCRWQIAGQTGNVTFLLGMMVLLAGVVVVYLARPLPPEGPLVRLPGVLTALGGAIFVVIARKDVHPDVFTLFINLPFALSGLFAAAMMAGAWWVRQAKTEDKQWKVIPALLVLAGLVLVWIVLSQEVYFYWACRNTYAGPVENWRFLAQMYMSVTWAIYGALLLVIGFALRARGVRYLSLVLFAVLLGKIFLNDLVRLRIEYRVAAFVTTGLVLLGVSFVYQFLKKKGFFEDKSQVLSETKE